MGKVLRLFVIAAIAVFGVVAATAPHAAAHNVLIASTPEDGATVAQAPDAVELVFDQTVQNEFPQVAVTDEDGTNYSEGEPEIVGETATQPISGLPAGEYTVSYRILSADGHPVDGSFTFTVSEGVSPGEESSAKSSAQPPAGGAASADSSSFPWGLVIAGAVVVGIGIAYSRAAAHRRRSAPGELK